MMTTQTARKMRFKEISAFPKVSLASERLQKAVALKDYAIGKGIPVSSQIRKLLNDAD